MLKVEKNDPFFDRDYNLCILCGRCVRQCEKLHFTGSIAYTKRGTHTLVGTAFNRTHLDAGCSFCGACVEVCPTGALSEKTRKWDGEADGETATTCPLCSLGCQVRLLTKNGRVIGSQPDHPAGADSLCVKGRFGFAELLNHPTRLTQPQKAVAGNRRLSITWEETIRLAAENLSGIAPERFEMLVSPNLSLESLYVAQKFTRQGMHSPHIHTNHLSGYAQDAGAFFKLVSQSQPLSILAEASTVLCLGLDNPYTQSVVEVRLHQAKVNGAKIVAAFCSDDSLGRFADLWLKSEDEHKPTLVIEQAAQLLITSPSTNPVILAGPAIFSHPDRVEILNAIQRLVNATQARLTVIPDQAELISLLLGIIGKPDLPSIPGRQALYLLGENIAELPPGEKPFILYQNIYPPVDGIDPDLILPATAFSEEDGSRVDYAGQAKTLHRAVPPPGEALPAWEILCRIARQMNLEGFDFTSLADIQAEMAALPGHCLANGQVDWASLSLPALLGIGRGTPAALQPVSDTYLGFPLTRYIPGLNQLAPAKGRPSHA
jgi:predicted molibdopterin-dependent oxidoreductase YjgC